jgi:hypothetical protein
VQVLQPLLLRPLKKQICLLMVLRGLLLIVKLMLPQAQPLQLKRLAPQARVQTPLLRVLMPQLRVKLMPQALQMLP